MTFAECRTNVLAEEWCRLVSPGALRVFEDAVGGEAEVEFEVRAEALHLRQIDDRPPLKWMQNRKCADDAIIIKSDEGVAVHIIELKSKLTRKEWIKARSQFEGMLANSMALLAVIGAPSPNRVVVHISYQSENVSSNQIADTVFLKLQVGSTSAIGQVDDWLAEKLELFGYTAELRKIPRDCVTRRGVGDLT